MVLEASLTNVLVARRPHLPLALSWVVALCLTAGCLKNPAKPADDIGDPDVDAEDSLPSADGGTRPAPKDSGGTSIGSADAGGPSPGTDNPKPTTQTDAAVPGADGPVASGPEAGADMAGVTTNPTNMPTNVCGTEHADVSRVMNANGLAIADDGTIYFTQQGPVHGWIGRLLPKGGGLNAQWMLVPLGIRLFGLAIDNANHALYVASNSGKAIHVVDLTGEPTLRDLITGIDSPNDIAVGPNGDVYYSEPADGRVYRVTRAGQRTEVTREVIGPLELKVHPAGLAFGRDGDLFVGTSGGKILRLALDNGVERSRSPFGGLNLWGNGMAFDSSGRLYVAVYSTISGPLYQLETDGALASKLAEGVQLTSVAFGRGALDCHDLYLASSNGPMRRFHIDRPGLPIP